jgi:hypothetical protein
VSVGEKFKKKIRARAIDDSSVLLQMGTDKKFLGALTTGSGVNVSASGTEMSFPTPPMKKVMASLDRCIKENKSTVSKSAEAIESVMPETLKALLIASGLKEIAPLAMDDIPVPQRPADFVWKTGNLLGGVREREMPKGKSLSELAGLHVEGLKNKCAGEFKTEIGREESAPGLRLRTADAMCKAKDRTIFVSMLFYISTNRVFTVFSHEGGKNDVKEAMAVRNSIKKTLMQLAENGTSKNR